MVPKRSQRRRFRGRNIQNCLFGYCGWCIIVCRSFTEARLPEEEEGAQPLLAPQISIMINTNRQSWVKVEQSCFAANMGFIQQILGLNGITLVRQPKK